MLEGANERAQGVGAGCQHTDPAGIREAGQFAINVEADVAPLGMYVAIFILYLIPWSLLLVAWRSTLKTVMAAIPQDWRSYCLRLALIAASIAILTAMGFNLSWTHNGGSPHGMDPGPGLWLTLRPIVKWPMLVTVVLGAFGKGKARVLVIGSALSISLVISMLAFLEMD